MPSKSDRKLISELNRTFWKDFALAFAIVLASIVIVFSLYVCFGGHLNASDPVHRSAPAKVEAKSWRTDHNNVIIHSWKVDASASPHSVNHADRKAEAYANRVRNFKDYREQTSTALKPATSQDATSDFIVTVTLTRKHESPATENYHKAVLNELKNINNNA